MHTPYSIVFFMGLLYCKRMPNKFYTSRSVKNMNRLLQSSIVLSLSPFPLWDAKTQRHNQNQYHH